MNENFVTADAIGKNKLTNQAKSLRRWEFFLLLFGCILELGLLHTRVRVLVFQENG